MDDAHILIATPGRLDDLVDRRLVKLERRARSSCWTRPTGCSTWGSSRRSTGSCGTCRRTARRCSSPPRSTAPSGRIAEVYTRNPVRHEIESDGKTVEEADHRFIPVDRTRSSRSSSSWRTAEAGTHARVREHEAPASSRWRASCGRRACRRVTMHGDMTQQAREKALQRFEDKHVGVLIATDVAARGLDLDDITLVVNYDPPLDDKGYVHRVGRTARAGRGGHQRHVRHARAARRRQPDGGAPGPARGVRAGGHEGRAAAHGVQRRAPRASAAGRGRRSAAEPPHGLAQPAARPR